MQDLLEQKEKYVNSIIEIQNWLSFEVSHNILREFKKGEGERLLLINICMIYLKETTYF